MSSNFIVTIDKTENIPLILGGTNSFIIRIKNTSTTQRLYNLGINITTPDGITVSSASASSVNQPITSTITNPDGSKIYSWVNLKDLAPMEIDYAFTVTVKGGTKYKDGTTIPFGYIFTGFSVKCQVDTMPRGIYDIGNQVLTETVSMTYKAVRFFATITTAGKVLKGAGSSLSLNDYTKTATATCNFSNNLISASYINAKILLPNGIRYIGNISVSGTDANQFQTPVISTVLIDGKVYTQIYFGGINLSIGSNTNVTFTYAVWNRYDDNTGAIITHGTRLSLLFYMYYLDEIVDSTATFSAMDLIISTSVNKSTTDVGQALQFTYIYSVGQYYDIQNIQVKYILPDGLSFVSGTPNPISVVDDPTSKGYLLTYEFAYAMKNSSSTVIINGSVDGYYRYKFNEEGDPLPVVADDGFFPVTNIRGELITLGTVVSDSAATGTSIGIGKITKSFIKGYYENGVAKTINALAPGDLAEYKLNYDASTLNAIQKQVYLDDFFPLAADPIDNLTYVYSGYVPVGLEPQLIEPHGVDFYYGDMQGNSNSTITFKVPIKTLGGAGQNNNLFKLKGINTDGYAYSSRTQVTINIGSPNLSLTKTVTGNNVLAIKANETYVYSVTIRNSSNLGTETDAFDFKVSDQLSSWFSIIPNQVVITGTGSYGTVEITDTTIALPINKLAPGQYVTLSYSVRIIDILAPGLTITTTASNTNPYSQQNNPSSYQYTNQNKTASATIKSQAISFTKSYNSEIIKIGSQIIYTITLTIPQGTTAYGVYVKDVLPNGLQVYDGSAFRNGVPITPTVVNNSITFPIEGTIDARLAAQSITYILYCKVINGTKTVGATTLTQTNNYQCIYKQTETGNNLTISKNLSVTINVPNIVLSLTATDTTTGIVYTSSGNINTSSILSYKLTFLNNSAIKLLNGVVEIPIDSDLTFVSLNLMVLGNAIYDSVNKKIRINIPSLDPGIQGFITFTAIPLSNLNAGTLITEQATAIQYYNDISIKIYSGEKSNIVSLTLPVALSLLPNPIDAINDSTSFRVSVPGATVEIINYFQNTGGGYDSFNLKIEKVALPYSLYIDDDKIADVPINTLYSADLPIMSNVPPGGKRTIKLVYTLPINLELGKSYNFIVTATSKTSPYPTKTVTNIDPKA